MIVNEVNSATRSRLMGPLEVAGQRADVIIANPSGLVVDGLSFLNAAGVTLTTGRPLYGTGGSLDGFSVQSGLIHAQGQGLDASQADYAHILARAVSLNAGVWAQDLRVVMGVNEIAADGKPSTAATAPQDRPQFALDVAQLGGMYAGRIFIVGTEAGLGARNAGTFSAMHAGLTLSVDGELRNTGAIASNATSADLKISAQGIANSGTLTSQQDLLLADGGAVTTNAGTLQAQRQLLAQMGHLDNQQAGVVVAQRLEISAAHLSNAGSITQTGSQALAISSTTLSSTGPQAVLGARAAPAVAAPLVIAQRLRAANGAAGVVHALGHEAQVALDVNGAGTVHQRAMRAVQLLRQQRSLAVVEQAIAVQIAHLNGSAVGQRRRGLQIGGAVGQQLAGVVQMLRHLDTAGGQHQRCSRHGLDQTAVQAGTGGGEAGVGQVVGTRLTAQVQETIDNQAGTLSAASDLSLSARNLANNAQVRIVSNAGSVHLAMSGTLSNRQGEITTASHGNLQIAKSKIDSEYASVNEQSGLKAGNGGFIIDVAKDTDLRGAVISSTQQAIDDKKNTFHTGGELTTSDIENIARYKAQGFSASGGMTPSQKGLTPTGGMGIGHKSSNATSTTYSGISGIAGKADIRTGDSETGVMNSFDAQKVREDVDAQVEITKQAGKNLSRTIGDYGQEKKEEAVDLLTQAEAIKESNPELSEELQHNAIQIEKDWGDNGNWRIGLHAIAGGLTGGIGGALGGAVGSATAPQVAAMLDDADIQGPLADTLVAAASTVAATTVGGTAGVAAGLNEVINNSLGHQAVNKLKNCLSGKSCKSDEEKELAIRWAEESSQKIDEETKSICGRDPVGDACRNAISTATKYVAMRDAWDFMKKDVARSSVSLFDYVYNSDAAKERINLYYSTIDKRADFFAASNLYEKNMGAGVKWYEGAEFVSRAPWTGLGADGNFSYLTFGVGRALAPVYSWREAAGKELMSGGFNNFRGVYNDKKSNPIAWDINQLQDEQKILQPIHEKYLGGGYGIFRKSIKFFTDEKLDILNGRQTIENGIDILDLDSRVKYGCKLLGYGAEQGCK